MREARKGIGCDCNEVVCTNHFPDTSEHEGAVNSAPAEFIPPSNHQLLVESEPLVSTVVLSSSDSEEQNDNNSVHTIESTSTIDMEPDDMEPLLLNV